MIFKLHFKYFINIRAKGEGGDRPPRPPLGYAPAENVIFPAWGNSSPLLKGQTLSRDGITNSNSTTNMAGEALPTGLGIWTEVFNFKRRISNKAFRHVRILVPNLR